MCRGSFWLKDQRTEHCEFAVVVGLVLVGLVASVGLVVVASVGLVVVAAAAAGLVLAACDCGGAIPSFAVFLSFLLSHLYDACYFLL